jgi:hypothetical protein
MARRYVVRSLLSATLLVGASALSACSAPADVEASSSNQAIAQDEVETERVASDFPSAAPQTTGVDVWDLALVTKGGATYLVLSGYTVAKDAAPGEPRRTPALDIVFDGEHGWTRPWSKQAEVPLSNASVLAVAADVEALGESLGEAASSEAAPGSVSTQRSNSCKARRQRIVALGVALGGVTFVVCTVASLGTAPGPCGLVGMAVFSANAAASQWTSGCSAPPPSNP